MPKETKKFGLATFYGVLVAKRMMPVIYFRFAALVRALCWSHLGHATLQQLMMARPQQYLLKKKKNFNFSASLKIPNQTVCQKLCSSLPSMTQNCNIPMQHQTRLREFWTPVGWKRWIQLIMKMLQCSASGSKKMTMAMNLTKTKKRCARSKSL